MCKILVTLDLLTGVAESGAHEPLQNLACKEDNFCSFKRSCIDMFSPRFSDLPPPLNYAHTSFYEILFDWQGFFSSFMSDLILRIYMKILEQKTIHSKLIMEWKYEFYTRGRPYKTSGFFWPFLIPPPPCRNFNPDLSNPYLLISCNIEIWDPPPSLKYSDIFYGWPLV